LVFDSMVVEGDQIDLSYLNKGIYLYRLSSGEKFKPGKVVIF
jgi:hypothetical protein